MFIESLGALSVGTRLKLLSNRLYDACDEVYRKRAGGVEARWALYLRLLCDRGPLSTTEIAEAVGMFGRQRSSVTGDASRSRACGIAFADFETPYDSAEDWLNPSDFVDDEQQKRAALAPLFDDLVTDREINVGLARQLLRRARSLRTALSRSRSWTTSSALLPLSATPACT